MLEIAIIMDWAQTTTTSALTAVITAVLTWMARPYFEAYLRKKGESKAVFEDLDRINRKLEEIRSDFLERNAYLAEKGKNTATKEDIEEVSRKVERIRTEYTAMIEFLKAQLSKRATIHRLQAEKEFQVVSEIWAAAVDLKMAMQDFAPWLEPVSANESEHERWREKFKAFHSRYNHLLLATEKQRPFYPADIYEALVGMLQAAMEAKTHCESNLAFADGAMPAGSYESRKQAVDKVLEITNNVCDTLRSRLSEPEGTA